MPYAVGPMTLADLDEVMAIERVSFASPWSARAYRYEITQNKHSTILVVRPASHPPGSLARLLRRLHVTSPGPVLGYAGFWLMVDEAHVCTIAVHPRWRGQGLGELLLLSLLERGDEQGACLATLEVRASNHVAQELYRKYEFTVVSVRRRYYSDNDEDAYIMTTPRFDTPEFRASLRQNRARLHARLRS